MECMEGAPRDIEAIPRWFCFCILMESLLVLFRWLL